MSDPANATQVNETAAPAPEGYVRVGMADPDLKLRNPDKAYRWLQHGEIVPRSQFWLRRLLCGDVVDLDVVDAAKKAEDEQRAAEKAAADAEPNSGKGKAPPPAKNA